MSYSSLSSRLRFFLIKLRGGLPGRGKKIKYRTWEIVQIIHEWIRTPPALRTYCMVRPLKVAVLLLSKHPQLDQCQLHLHPSHKTDLSTYLPQLVIILMKEAVRGVPVN